MRKNPIQGKKGKARADAVRKEWKRIKEGKFESEKEKFMFDSLLKEKKGKFIGVKIGFKNAYKNLIPEKKAFYFNESMNTMNGYNLLKKKGIPVAEYKGTVKIRGKEKEVFEKARDLTKKEAHDKINELIKIVEKASKAGIFIDTNIENFGINKDGKIVIRDTNYVEKKPQKEALYYSLTRLQQSLIEYGAADMKDIERIKKFKRNV